MSTVEEKPRRELTIRERLNSPQQMAEIARALPAHCKPERMARVALTALMRTPLLEQCTQASFFRCLLDLSQWGLEPDGRRAHLIPFRNNKSETVECTLILDYKGLVELAYRSGSVKSIHADVVRDGDLFDFNLGQVTRHTPWFLRRDDSKVAEPGEVFAAYCLIELAGGVKKCEVLSRSEIDGIRRRSKAGNAGPWVSDWCEMAKKTAFRRASKWIPISAELIDAFDRDDDKIEPEAPAPAVNLPSKSLAELTEMLAGNSKQDPDAVYIDEAVRRPQDAHFGDDETQETVSPLLDEAQVGFANTDSLIRCGELERNLLGRATPAEKSHVSAMAHAARERIRGGRGSK